MTIYLDIDEVCWESIEAVLIILNERYGTKFLPCDVNTWNFTNCFPNMTGDEIEEIFNMKDFFKHVRWKQGCLDFIRRHFDDIKFITKGNPSNLVQKILYLNKFFSVKEVRDRFIGLGLRDNKNKYMVSDSILIDDNVENLNSSNAKINILFENVPNAEWNKDWKGLRVKSFYELEELLDKYMIL